MRRLFMSFVVVSLIFLQFSFARTAHAQSETEYWLAEFTRVEELYRNAWTEPDQVPDIPQSDGASVGWTDGSYALPAYLDMYEWSLDTSYLDRFVTRADQVVGFMRDANQDGFLSWPSARYSPNLLANPDFENGAVSWSNLTTSILRRYESAPASIHYWPVTGECEAYTSKVGLGSNYAGLANGKQISQTVVVNPARSYRFSVHLKIPAGMALHLKIFQTTLSGRSEIVLDRVVSQTNLGPQGWQIFSEEVNSGGYPKLTVLLAAEGGINKIRIDNVKLSPFEEYITIDGSMAASLARFAYLVNRDGLMAYSTQARSYQQIAEGLVLKWLPGWRNVDGERSVYIAPNDESTVIPGDTLPYNQMIIVGLANYYLGQLSQHYFPVDYASQAVKIASTFKAAFRANDSNPSAVMWNYRDSLLPTDTYPDKWLRLEDVNHAGPGVEFAGIMYRAGLVFSEQDVSAISAALMGFWNGDNENPVIMSRIDGGGEQVNLALGSPFMRHLSINPQNFDLQDEMAVSWQNDLMQQHLVCHAGPQALSTGHHLSIPSLLLMGGDR